MSGFTDPLYIVDCHLGKPPEFLIKNVITCLRTNVTAHYRKLLTWLTQYPEVMRALCIEVGVCKLRRKRQLVFRLHAKPSYWRLGHDE